MVLGEIIRKVGYQYVKILEIKNLDYFSNVTLVLIQVLRIYRPRYNFRYLWNIGTFAFHITDYAWFFASTFQKVFQVRY